MSTPDTDQDDALHGVPKPLVDLLSEICGVVGVGTLDSGVATVEGTVQRDGQRWLCQASAFPGGVLVAKSVWPDRVAADRLRDVEELISRVNWALLTGNAELDHRDGTVRFRTDLCLVDEPLTDGLAEGLILPNVGTASLLFPHLAAVAAGTEKPDRAADDMIDQVENEGISMAR